MTKSDEGNIRRECGVSRARRKKRCLGAVFIGVVLLIAGGWAAHGEGHEMELASSEYDPVQEFVSEYYEAAGGLVWGTTYSLLDDEVKSQIAEDEWSLAQNARYAENPTPPVRSAEVVDSETAGESIVADLLITYEDGGQEEISGFAMSINASGGIERSLTDEDVGYLMDLVNKHRGDNEFEVYRDCPDGPGSAQYGANCDIVTSASSPVMEDVAEDAMRDTTTSTGAINPEETTEGTTADAIVDNIEDAMRDATTAAGAINPEETTVVSVPGNVDVAEDAARDATAAAGAVNESAAIEELMVEETAEASGNEETSVEDTSVEGASFEEASVVGRLEPLAVVGGGAAILFGVVLVGRFFWKSI